VRLTLSNSLQSRLLLGAGAWSVLALIITGLLLAYLMREQLESQVQQRLAADMTQLLGKVEMSADERLTIQRDLSDPLYQKIYSGSYWQLSRDGVVVLRSRSLWDQDLPPQAAQPSDESGFAYLGGPQSQKLLSLQRQVTLPRVPGRLSVQITRDLAEIDSAMRQFNLVLASGLGILALGLIVASFLQVRLGLRPLRRMRRGLAEIRQGEATGLTGRYPVEVQPLVEDLNGVLSDNAALIERARSRAGNLAHALKTPLSVLANEARERQRAGDPVGDRLDVEIRNMRTQLDWHLAHARVAAARRPGMSTSVDFVADRLVRTLTKLYPENRIDRHGTTGLKFAGELQDLEQMLGNLLDNACKWATRQVDLRVADNASGILICVEDDGPGLSDELKVHALQRGKRLDEKSPGDGLGLSIVKELAELYRGELRLGDAPAGGLAVTLVLPAVNAERR
jgi:signal transduction histidine kinase